MARHKKSQIPRTLRAAALAAVLAALTAPAAPAAEPGAAPSAARQRLAAGETLVRMASEGAEGRAWRVLEVPPERVRRTVADLRHYAEFFPFVRLSQVWHEDDGRLLSRQVVDVPFPYGERVVTAQVELAPVERSARRAGWTLRWESLEGSEQRQRATWTVRPFAGGRTLVSLHLATDADGIPSRLERRALEQSLPWILDGLRQQVNRCRYDLPIHESCAETPPFPSLAPAAPPPRAPAPPAPADSAPGGAPPDDAEPPEEDPP